jgi:hypothetical protein
MGEGWTQAEIDSGAYARAADEVIREGLLRKEPYASYANLINITRINVPSVERGVGDEHSPLAPTGGATRTSTGTEPRRDPDSPAFAGEAETPADGGTGEGETAPGEGAATGEEASAPGEGAPEPGPDPATGPTDGPVLPPQPVGGVVAPPMPTDIPPPVSGGQSSPTRPTVTPTPTARPTTPPRPTTTPTPTPNRQLGQIPTGQACPPSRALPQSRVLDTYFGVWRRANRTGTNTSPGDTVWFMNETCAVRRMAEVNPRLPRHVVVIILNTTHGRGAARFGGSGSFGYTNIPLHERRLETISHEMGHSLVNLADEYSEAGRAAPTSEPIEENVTINNDRRTVKWKDWIEARTPGIGLIEGGKYAATGVWRPKENCQMKSHRNTFCEICYEQTLHRFYSAVSLIDSVTPTAREVALTTGQSASFRVNSVGPRNGRIVGEWTLDGRPVRGTRAEGANGPTFECTLERLVAGQHELKFVVADNTPSLLSRREPRWARRPNQRIWAVRVRQPDRAPGLEPVPVE